MRALVGRVAGDSLSGTWDAEGTQGRTTYRIIDRNTIRVHDEIRRGGRVALLRRLHAGPAAREGDSADALTGRGPCRRVPGPCTNPAPTRPAGSKSSSAACTAARREELIRRLRRAQIARQQVEIFKPVDRRPLRARPHRLAQRVAHPLAPGRDARPRSCAAPHEAQVIGIDEGQFLGPDLPAVVRAPRRGRQARDRRRARPGLPRPAVRADAAAARHRRVHHQDARHLRGVRRARQPHATARAPASGRVVVGGADLYEARCRRCYDLARRGARRRGDDVRRRAAPSRRTA